MKVVYIKLAITFPLDTNHLPVAYSDFVVHILVAIKNAPVKVSFHLAIAQLYSALSLCNLKY